MNQICELNFFDMSQDESGKVESILQLCFLNLFYNLTLKNLYILKINYIIINIKLLKNI
jgi:hypothetical protein